MLADVSLTLAAGEAAAIMGPSGSGKSTLLYMLGALEPPTSGTITLDGRNPFELDDECLAAFRNKELGFVFQDHCLLPQCSVLENVLIPTLVAPGGDDDLRRARVLIDQVGLADRADHRPDALSGGERQRAAIARALVRQPGCSCAMSRPVTSIARRPTTSRRFFSICTGDSRRFSSS